VIVGTLTVTAVVSLLVSRRRSQAEVEAQSGPRRETTGH
jgi:hypothetical protein